MLRVRNGARLTRPQLQAQRKPIADEAVRQHSPPKSERDRSNFMQLQQSKIAVKNFLHAKVDAGSSELTGYGLVRLTSKSNDIPALYSYNLLVLCVALGEQYCG
jgi:hypothetical protein